MKRIIDKRIAIAGLMVLALSAGCASMPGILPGQGMTPEELLAFQDKLNHAAPGELAKQYNGLNAIPEQTRSDSDTLKLALLLSQPGFPSHNDAAALRLLQDHEPQLLGHARLAPFVRWLRSSLQERVRLADSAEDTAAQLRDEKKRGDACNDKLQAIRKMEDSLIDHNRH